MNTDQTLRLLNMPEYTTRPHRTGKTNYVVEFSLCDVMAVIEGYNREFINMMRLFYLSNLSMVPRVRARSLDMADEYKAVLTGGLSLKGGLFKNKKKKKGKRKRDESATSTSAQEGVSEENFDSKSGLDDADGSGLNGKGEKDGSDVDPQAGEDIEDMLTPAQRKFRQKQLKREGRTIRKMVEKTHRERVEEFNALLASMTEHNDIPRCSAAGNG